ncbi:MAG: hypothetical protein JNJ75_14825 [Cyclobacteriaceae bacterium]|nr:hypothetical protein [Cyclobacteriaceae bacterium]
MKKPATDSGLLLRIDTLNVSEQFRLMAQLNGLITLGDLVSSDLDKLPLRDGSGMRVLAEAMEILEEFGLEKLTED